MLLSFGTLPPQRGRRALGRAALAVVAGSLAACSTLPGARYVESDWPADLRSKARDCSERINVAAEAYQESSQWEFWTGIGLGGAGATLGTISVAADNNSIGSWTAVGIGLLATGRQIALSQGWLDTEGARGRYDRAVGRLSEAEDHRADAGQLKRVNKVVHLDMTAPTWKVGISTLGRCEAPTLLKGQWSAGSTDWSCKDKVEITMTTETTPEGMEQEFLEGSNPAPATAPGRCTVQLACYGQEDADVFAEHIEAVRSSLIDCVRDPGPEPLDEEEEGGESEPEGAPAPPAEAAPTEPAPAIEAAPETPGA